MTKTATPHPATPRRLRLGMVGGGQGALIGAVHRIAARLDDCYEFTAGALSSDPARALASAVELRLAPERCYADFQTMAQAEAGRDDGIDVVAIVTPNHLHYPVAKAFLEAGIHVICDKPLVHTLAQAEELAALVQRKNLVFTLTHNYSGYPMVRQAREMIAAGELGAIRVVQVEYAQDWLTTALEETGNKQALWRTDPAQSGIAGCVGDIGTHAFQLAEYVSGLTCSAVAADLSCFVPNRRLDDNAHILMRYTSGARGMLWASQVSPGNANALRLRIYGDKGGLEWFQENPEILHFTRLGQPTTILQRNRPGTRPSALHASRIPGGHPEGYLEGFAQIYRDTAELIHARLEKRSPQAGANAAPTIADGLRGVRFIHSAVTSSQNNAGWVELG